jgi:hypothetical protein
MYDRSLGIISPSVHGGTNEAVFSGGVFWRIWLPGWNVLDTLLFVRHIFWLFWRFWVCTGVVT